MFKNNANYSEVPGTGKTRPRRFRFGLRLRFVLVILAVLTLIFAILALLLLRNTRASLTDDLNTNSKAFAELATRPIGDTYSVYQSYGGLRVSQEIHKFTSLNSAVSNVVITSVDGSQLYALNNSSVPKISEADASAFEATYKSGDNGAHSAIVQPYFDTNGLHQFAVTYVISTVELEQTIRREFVTIISLSLFGLALAAAVTYFLINRLFLRPLESVSRASLAISNGRYEQQVSRQRNDEIGDLALSVNQMATNLKANIFQLQEVDTMKNEFIMITSHNLRTPLTIIEGYMEIIRDSELSAEMRKMIDAIQGGLRSLASFSEDILTIASIESGKTSLSVRPTTVRELLKGIRGTYREAAELKGVQLDWQIGDPETRLSLSATHIRGVLRNLLDNAIKFSKSGGHVDLRLRTDGNTLVITVTDDGIGIAPEEMRKLFTKFHRGTSTYTYDYEGTGIGLYATKLIVQAHGGKVSATSTLGQGSTFTVSLPGAVIIGMPAAGTDSAGQQMAAPENHQINRG